MKKLVLLVVLFAVPALAQQPVQKTDKPAPTLTAEQHAHLRDLEYQIQKDNAQIKQLQEAYQPVQADLQKTEADFQAAMGDINKQFPGFIVDPDTLKLNPVPTPQPAAKKPW